MSASAILPTPAEVRAAAARIAERVRRTPLVRSEGLSAFLGGDVWLKLECEQETCSFKLRGATNVLAQLDDLARAAGVVASSAGNHGLGIASAAAAIGIRATVFVPRTAPAVKREKIAALGATVDATAATYDDAEQLARTHAAEIGATFVSPCTGRALLAGQGTVALEVLEELPTLGTIVVSVGGGGLVGGVGGLLRGDAPLVRILGVQSERTNAMALALRSGMPANPPDLPTLADGLTGLVDAEMLAQGQAAIDTMVTVREADIASAIAWLWMEESVKAEGAGAAGVAALLAGQAGELVFPAVVIVSGGNIDEAVHRGVLAGS